MYIILFVVCDKLLLFLLCDIFCEFSFVIFVVVGAVVVLHIPVVVDCLTLKNVLSVLYFVDLASDDKRMVPVCMEFYLVHWVDSS